MSNATDRTSAFTSLNLGGNLIEIAALTALIGSTTAESLVLGNKGAVGLLWGTMSIFGALSVIKACIAAATPDWLRETFGVRSREVDNAIGVSLDLDSKSLQSIRKGTGAAGVACKIRVDVDEKAPDGESTEVSRHDIYVFDQCASGILDLVPEIEASGTFQTHVLIQDAYSKENNTRIAWVDWIGIISSSVKILELSILWKHNAIDLVIISACCWGFFLISSMLLQVLGLSREYSDRMKEREIDLVAGQLPTPIKAGGSHKMLLGAPQNVRQSVIWKIIWGCGSIVSTAAVIATYTFLGNQESNVFAMWTAFQFTWLALRSVFFHFVEGTDRVFHHPILIKHEWRGLSMELRTRIRRLVTTLSKYQMHIHPRGIYCYEEDLQQLDTLYDMEAYYPLLSGDIDSGNCEIDVVAIIGDTLLSSACWMFGSKLSGLDLYDSCVLILHVRGSTIAIPAARVLSDKTAAPKPDVEAGIGPLFPLRGNSNTGRDIYWMYWIPCGEGRWLQVQTTDMKFLGVRSAEIRSDAQVTQKLAKGEILVSLSAVNHVKEIVQHSRTGFDIVQNLLR